MISKNYLHKGLGLNRTFEPKNIKYIAGFVAILGIGSLLSTLSAGMDGFGVFYSALVGLLWIAFWALSNKDITKLPAFTDKKDSKSSLPVLIVMQFITAILVFAVIWHTLALYFSSGVINPLNFDVPLVLQFSIPAFLIIAIFGFFKFINGNSSYYSLVVHSSGALFFIVSLHEVYSSLSVFDGFVYRIIPSVTLYLVGVILSIFFYIFRKTLFSEKE